MQLERLRGAVSLPTLVLPDAFAEEFGEPEALWVSELLEGQLEGTLEAGIMDRDGGQHRRRTRHARGRRS
jgi:hypothetical protein